MSSRTPARSLADAAAAADDDALADAGLPLEGDDAGEAPRRARVSLAHRLYSGEAGLDFIGKRKLWYGSPPSWCCSASLSIIFRGFNFGIEFAGGNVPGAGRTAGS